MIRCSAAGFVGIEREIFEAPSGAAIAVFGEIV